MTGSASQRISPTAHYTGFVWARNDVGDPALATTSGRVLYRAGQLVMAPVAAAGGPTLEHFLLARHRIIDHLLRREVVSGQATQIVELAAGFSPRGLRFVREHPRVTYVEVDLPDMARRKRAVLDRIGTDRNRHRVAAGDVFGPDLDAVMAELDRDAGVVVVTEGLLNYFPTAQVRRLWTRVAAGLAQHAHGVYLSDLHLEPAGRRIDRAFARALGAFVRGHVHFHFTDADQAEAALRSAGFAIGRLHRPVEYDGVLPGMTAAGAGRVRVIEARVAEADYSPPS